MNTKHIIPLVIGAAIIGGGSFYGGTIFAKTHAASTQGGQRQGGRGGAGFNGQGRGANGGFTSGQVTAKDASSLTISMPMGGSKIVFYASSTRVGKMVDGSIDDVGVGTNVVVTGSANSDGSITASSLQIRPQLPDGQGAGRPRGATSTP